MGKSFIMVDVTVTLDFASATNPTLKSYSGSSTPGGKDVVKSDGSINLTKVDKGNNDRSNALISFTLDTVNNSGLVSAWFAGIELKDSEGKRYTGTELVSAITGPQVVILDLDEDGGTYSYCLTIGFGSATSPGSLKLDPPLVNRSGGR